MNGTITPLEARRFFQGTWTGEGELIPRRLLRWVVRRASVRMRSEPLWLSDTIWLVRDRFEFSSGHVMDRKMFCELVAGDRIHVTADDMPGGADIQLHDHGFRFTPYDILVKYRSVRVRLRCYDENTLDRHGFLHDCVEMRSWGLHVATLRIGPICRNVESP